MGWGYGINNEGREVGYYVQATCDQPACEAEIDRGLAYVCGGMHDGGDYGCGEYFCGKHLQMTLGGQLCSPCADSYYEAHDEEDDSHLAVCAACAARVAEDQRVQAWRAEHPRHE